MSIVHSPFKCMPTMKDQLRKLDVPLKKRLEINEQKNEVETTSPNKKGKVQKEVKDLTLIFIVPMLKIYLYYEE